MLKLDTTQMSLLRSYKERIEKTIFGVGLGVPLFFLVMSFIPAKFIPSKRPGRITDGDSSLADLMGVGNLLIGIIILAVIIIFWLMRTYKYMRIKKDLIERGKVVTRGKVQKFVVKEGGGPQEIELWITPKYKNKRSIEFIEYPNFPMLRRGEQVEIELTAIADYPIKITQIGADGKKLDDAQSLLALFKKIQRER